MGAGSRRGSFTIAGNLAHAAWSVALDSAAQLVLASDPGVVVRPGEAPELLPDSVAIFR